MEEDQRLEVIIGSIGTGKTACAREPVSNNREKWPEGDRALIPGHPKPEWVVEACRLVTYQ